MKKLVLNTTLSVTILFVSVFYIMQKVVAETTNFEQQIYAITECNDGIDNDGDGGIDFASDVDCTSWEDESELADEDEELIPFQQQLVDTNEESNGEVRSVRGYLDKFVWEPLGYILGTDEDSSLSGDLRSSSEELSFIIVTMLILLIVLLTGLIYLAIRGEKEDEEKNEE